MEKIRIGINGFGRIGRLAFRIASKRPNIEVVGINDLVDANYLAYLLKYDTVHGRFDGEVYVNDKGNLVVNGNEIRVTAEKDPANLRWDEVGATYVIESTGLFLTREKAEAHLKAGAKKVIMSAPSKDDTPMFVLGGNHDKLTYDHDIISNASCTTNCFVPVLKVLHENFGVIEGLMTTVHSVTANQKTVDGISKDWRRGRASFNIVPTTTGAAKAATKVLPELKGKVNAMSMRVPTLDASIIDFVVRLEKPTSYEEIKAAMKKAAEGELKGVLEYNEDAIVSSDIIGNPHSSVFDAGAGMELNDHFFKIISWYDNEWGYSNRLIDMIEYWDKLK